MIIILGAQQRSFLTMERRGALQICLPLSLSLSLYSCLFVWHRILFYISIISLFDAISFLLLPILLLLPAFCPRKLFCSLVCHLSLQSLIGVCECFWQFVENCIIPALSWRFYINFLFGFPLWRQRNLIFSAWIYCRPAGNLFSSILQLRKKTINYFCGKRSYFIGI